MFSVPFQFASRPCARLPVLGLCIGMALSVVGPSLAQQTGNSAHKNVASQRTSPIDLPAGDLADSLNALARQMGLMLSVDARLVAGKSAPAVAGDLSPREALDRLLAGSGLTYSLADAVVTLRQSGPAQLGPIEVLGEYRNNASSILRNGLEPEEMPRSVQVIPKDLIEEVKPEALEGVLALTSNAAFLGDNDGRENTFTLRGFQETPVLRDGFRVETFGGVADPELYNLDSVEVLKGPDSILFGEANPGGLINMRAKRPLKHDHGEVVLDYGTDGMVSPKVDVGGALGNGHKARYRIVGLYKRDQAWRDYDDPNKRTFFAPSLEWAITEDTAVTLIGEYTDDDYQADFGTAIDLDGDLTAPIEQVSNHPQDRIERHQYTFGADLVHSLSDDWHVNARVRRFDGGYEYSALWLPFELDLATNSYLRVAAQQEQRNKETALQISIAGDTEIAGLTNHLVVGGDYRQSETENSTRFDPSMASFLDWDNPDYSQLPPPASAIPSAEGFYSSDDIDRLGLFAQNHTNLTDKLTVSVGFRHDKIDRTPRPGSASTAQDLSANSAQAGVAYELSDSLSVFASYSESFNPSFDLDKNNNVLDPEEGEGYEVGIKGFGIADRVTFTAAYFDITKENVAVTDPSTAPTDPNPFGSIAAAKQTSRGFELDVEANLTPGWKLYGALGYADTNDSGERIVGAPKYTGSLWTSYRFNTANLRGLTVGGGVQYVGNRLAIADPNFDGNNSDRVFVDGYTLVNLFARYQVDDWTMQLNLNNVTDERYVHAAWNGLSRSVHAGAPFEAIASVRYRFK